MPEPPLPGTEPRASRAAAHALVLLRPRAEPADLPLVPALPRHHRGRPGGRPADRVPVRRVLTSRLLAPDMPADLMTDAVARLRRWARERPDAALLLTRGHEYTYADVFARASSVAAALRAAGARPRPPRGAAARGVRRVLRRHARRVAGRRRGRAAQRQPAARRRRLARRQGAAGRAGAGRRAPPTAARRRASSSRSAGGWCACSVRAPGEDGRVEGLAAAGEAPPPGAAAQSRGPRSSRCARTTWR